MLEPYLRDLGLIFDQFLLISEIEPNKLYVGYVRVVHDSHVLDHGIWFSNIVRIRVTFEDSIQMQIHPVHMRKEILQWTAGKLLLDKRENVYSHSLST